jgi:hypothetical protein
VTQRFVARNKRTNTPWKNYFCIISTASHNAGAMITVPKSTLFGALLIAGALSGPVFAQQIGASPATTGESPDEGPHYADFAPLVLESPLLVDATIHRTDLITGPAAAGVAPGFARLYVEADVNALIRGPHGIPARIGYLVDVPTDARGRPPRLKKERVLLFARPVAGRPAQLQLIAKDAQRRWTPAAYALVQRIAQQAAAPNPPPVITGVANAFHVPGSLPGEGETQIFLSTADGRPVSLDILRRPGEQPRWSVALSDITDSSASAPARDTLLWYRLACALPPQLPDSSLAAVDPDAAAKAREDYRFVLDSLGPCDRRAAY